MNALSAVTVLLIVLSACREKGANPDSAVNGSPAKVQKSAGDDDHGHTHDDGHSHDEQVEQDGAHDHDEKGHVDEVTLTADAVQRYGIKIEKASLRRLSPSFVAPARVAFNAEAIAHVGSTLPGRVVELAVRLGDVVDKGDVLLVVESPQLGEAQSAFLQKLIAAEATMATVDAAKNSLDRAKRLYDQNRGIAFDDVQKREVEFKIAQAALKTAESNAVAAENTLHVLGMSQEAVEQLRESGEVDPRFAIRAPIAGEVVQREVTLGELVHPERDALLVIADVQTLWVLADVPEAHLPKVAKGAMVWINAGNLDAHKHQGRVSYVAPMIEPHTRTSSVRVEVQCEDRSLKPGMFVQVEIVASNRSRFGAQPVIAIPQEAVQVVEGQSAVFVPVPEEENTFAKRPIVAGKPIGGMVPVFRGLSADEPYVASGSFLLKADLGKSAAQHNH